MSMSNEEILHPSVRSALDASALAYEAVPCRDEWADTAEFCAHYGIPAADACNAILVALKMVPRRYVACLVRADTRIDVNHRLAAEAGFKRLSFASSEEAAQVSGQTIGGVSLVGLPPDIPVIVDTAVFQRRSIIIGGGNRTSKVRLDPHELEKLPNVRVAEIAVPR